MAPLSNSTSRCVFFCWKTWKDPSHCSIRLIAEEECSTMKNTIATCVAVIKKLELPALSEANRSHLCRKREFIRYTESARKRRNIYET
jgi:hypothetical protein